MTTTPTTLATVPAITKLGAPCVITCGAPSTGAQYPGYVAIVAAQLRAAGAVLVAMTSRCKVVAPAVVIAKAGDLAAIGKHGKAWGGVVFSGYAEAHKGALYLTCTSSDTAPHERYDSTDTAPDAPAVVASPAAQRCQQLRCIGGYEHSDEQASAVAAAMLRGAMCCARLDQRQLAQLVTGDAPTVSAPQAPEVPASAQPTDPTLALAPADDSDPLATPANVVNSVASVEADALAALASLADLTSDDDDNDTAALAEAELHAAGLKARSDAAANPATSRPSSRAKRDARKAKRGN